MTCCLEGVCRAFSGICCLYTQGIKILCYTENGKNMFLLNFYKYLTHCAVRLPFHITLCKIYIWSLVYSQTIRLYTSTCPSTATGCKPLELLFSPQCRLINIRLAWRVVNRVYSFVWRFLACRMLTVLSGFCYIGFINPIGAVAGIRRQIVDLSIGPNRVASSEDRVRIQSPKRCFKQLAGLKVMNRSVVAVWLVVL